LEPISDLITSDSPQIELLIDIEQAFRKLARPLQEAFVLVKAEGLTSKDAAEILKIPEGTVRARVHEAVHRMRGYLTTPSSFPIILQEAQP
jgi:DNA-directed RNA polymerase specialized sigma24 family protein